jgi:hypothetical protein
MWSSSADTRSCTQLLIDRHDSRRSWTAVYATRQSRRRGGGDDTAFRGVDCGATQL